MRWLSDTWFRIRALFARSKMERGLDEEVRFHLEMETRKNVESGMDPDAARRAALLSFGGVDRMKERARASWGVTVAEDLASDVRFAVRQLVKRPAFGALAILTLSLGIGGTVALFSVVNGIMLRPLPFATEDRIVTFWSDYNWRGVEFDFVKERAQAYERLAAFSTSSGAMRIGDETSVLSSAVSSVELFDVLGARPMMGRTFRVGEDRPGAEPVMVLSHSTWQRELSADPDVIGRRVLVDGAPVTVIGVMPEDFYFPTPEYQAWLPLDLDPESSNYQGNGFLVLLGRLRPAVSPELVQDDLAGITSALGERFTYPEAWDKTKGAYVLPIREYLLGDATPALLLLLGAVGLLLLMACANVTALLLTRTADRSGEMAVRTALGAGRGRLARQILSESVVLGVLGWRCRRGSGGLIVRRPRRDAAPRERFR